MARPLVSVSFSNTVTPALASAPRRVQEAVATVVQNTSNVAFNRIRSATPRDRGTAAAGWRRRVAGNTVFIENNVDHINVLEYGGYPVIPAWKKRRNPGGLKRGNAFLGGGYPAGPRTVRAPSGDPPMLQRSNVSRQAPRGMVRKTLADIQPQYIFDLSEAIDRALNEGGA